MCYVVFGLLLFGLFCGILAVICSMCGQNSDSQDNLEYSVFEEPLAVQDDSEDTADQDDQDLYGFGNTEE